MRFQINGKPALPLLQVAEPLAEKKKQVPKGASLQLHGIACRVLGPGFVQVKQVPQMLRFLRGMTPFPELKAVQVGPVQRFHAESRDLVPVNAKELQLRLEDRVTAAAEPVAEPAAAAAEEPAAEEPATEEPAAAEDIAEEPAAEDIVEEPEAAAELAAAEDIAAEEPAAEAAAEEPAAEDIAEEPEGFDVHMRGGPYARVLGDLYHAGQILEKLDFEVQLQLYTIGQPQEGLAPGVQRGPEDGGGPPQRQGLRCGGRHRQGDAGHDADARAHRAQRLLGLLGGGPPRDREQLRQAPQGRPRALRPGDPVQRRRRHFVLRGLRSQHADRPLRGRHRPAPEPGARHRRGHVIPPKQRPNGQSAAQKEVFSAPCPNPKP